ncbi:hypothetical protein BH23ACT9_BH23ACT9_24200 [soil metagenome]
MTRITQRLVSQSSLANLQQSLGRTATLQVRLATGRMLNRLSDSPAGLVTAMQTRSAIARIDMPETIMELQMQEVAYQAALGATARVLQPSLLDFLR